MPFRDVMQHGIIRGVSASGRWVVRMKGFLQLRLVGRRLAGSWKNIHLKGSISRGRKRDFLKVCIFYPSSIRAFLDDSSGF